MRKPSLKFSNFRLRVCLLAVLLVSVFVFSEPVKKRMIFSEEGGIQWVDEKGNLIDPVKKKSTEIIIERKIVRTPVKPTLGNTLFQVEENYLSGQRLYVKQNYPKAMEYFERAYRLSLDPIYLYQVALCYLRLNELEKMKQSFKQILKQHPKSEIADDALWQLAQFEKGKRFYSRAIEYYRSLVNDYPRSRSLQGETNLSKEAQLEIVALEQEMRSYLQKMGFSGELTESIKQFQKQNGLKPFGLMDSATVSLAAELYKWKILEDEEEHVDHLGRFFMNGAALWSYFFYKEGRIWIAGICDLVLISMVLSQFLFIGKMNKLSRKFSVESERDPEKN